MCSLMGYKWQQTTGDMFFKTEGCQTHVQGHQHVGQYDHLKNFVSQFVRVLKRLPPETWVEPSLKSLLFFFPSLLPPFIIFTLLLPNARGLKLAEQDP